MDVTVIIVNYNTIELTKKCIDSIFEWTKDINFEVILVDNASMDGSVEQFQNDKRIIFIKLDENIGFGKANNVGYSVAKGKYIFLLNSDTTLLNNSLKYFFDNAESMPKRYAAFGCLLRDEKNEYCSSFCNYLSVWESIKFSINVYSKYFGVRLKTWNEKENIKQTPFDVEVIVGADLFIRKEIPDSIGLFEPKFFMYYEENDLQRRFAIAGYSMCIIDGPQIIHYEGKSSGKSLKREVLGMRGMFTYIKIWYPKFIYLLFRLCFFFLRLPVLFYSKYSLQDKKYFFKNLMFNAD